LAAAATAAPVTWQLEGTVRAILSCCGATYVPVADPGLTSLGVVPGAPYTATIVLEASVPDGDPSPDFGSYAAVTGLDFLAGTYHLGPGARFQVLNVNVVDQLMILDAGFPTGAGTVFTDPTFGFEVVADVPGTFPTDALPIDPPPVANLHPYDPGELHFGFGTTFAIIGHGTGQGTSQWEQIRADVTRWVRVPEPGVTALLAAALASWIVQVRLRAGAA